MLRKTNQVWLDCVNQVLASMRPQQNAAEDDVLGHYEVDHAGASMRPQQNAAEDGSAIANLSIKAALQ